MDLAYSLVTEDGPHRLVFESIPGGMRYAFGAIAGAVALWFAYSTLQAHTEEEAVLRWIGMLWYAAPAVFFAIVAIAIGFGRERLSIDATERTARLERRLGPAQWSDAITLPAQGVIRVEFAKERSGSTKHWTTSTRYTVTIKGVEGVA